MSFFQGNCFSHAFIVYLKGPYKKAGERLFTRSCGDRTRGNGCKLKEGRFKIRYEL